MVVVRSAGGVIGDCGGQGGSAAASPRPITIVVFLCGSRYCCCCCGVDGGVVVDSPVGGVVVDSPVGDFVVSVISSCATSLQFPQQQKTKTHTHFAVWYYRNES